MSEEQLLQYAKTEFEIKQEMQGQLDEYDLQLIADAFEVDLRKLKRKVGWID